MTYIDDYKRNLARKQGSSPQADYPIGLFSTSGQCIATLSTDESGRKFVQKSIKASKHALRTPPGLGMDTHALNTAKAEGAEYIVVHDKETGNRFWTWIDTMFSVGFAFNRGFGEQIGLPWVHWLNTRDIPAGSHVETIQVVVKKNEPEQLDLFQSRRERES